MKKFTTNDQVDEEFTHKATKDKKNVPFQCSPFCSLKKRTKPPSKCQLTMSLKLRSISVQTSCMKCPPCLKKNQNASKKNGNQKVISSKTSVNKSEVSFNDDTYIRSFEREVDSKKDDIELTNDDIIEISPSATDSIKSKEIEKSYVDKLEYSPPTTKLSMPKEFHDKGSSEISLCKDCPPCSKEAQQLIEQPSAELDDRSTQTSASSLSNDDSKTPPYDVITAEVDKDDNMFKESNTSTQMDHFNSTTEIKSIRSDEKLEEPSTHREEKNPISETSSCTECQPCFKEVGIGESMRKYEEEPMSITKDYKERSPDEDEIGSARSSTSMEMDAKSYDRSASHGNERQQMGSIAILVRVNYPNSPNDVNNNIQKKTSDELKGIFSEVGELTAESNVSEFETKEYHQENTGDKLEFSTHDMRYKVYVPNTKTDEISSEIHRVSEEKMPMDAVGKNEDSVEEVYPVSSIFRTKMKKTSVDLEYETSKTRKRLSSSVIYSKEDIWQVSRPLRNSLRNNFRPTEDNKMPISSNLFEKPELLASNIVTTMAIDYSSNNQTEENEKQMNENSTYIDNEAEPENFFTKKISNKSSEELIRPMKMDNKTQTQTEGSYISNERKSSNSSSSDSQSNRIRNRSNNLQILSDEIETAMQISHSSNTQSERENTAISDKKNRNDSSFSDYHMRRDRIDFEEDKSELFDNKNQENFSYFQPESSGLNFRQRKLTSAEIDSQKPKDNLLNSQIQIWNIKVDYDSNEKTNQPKKLSTKLRSLSSIKVTHKGSSGHLEENNAKLSKMRNSKTESIGNNYSNQGKPATRRFSNKSQSSSVEIGKHNSLKNTSDDKSEKGIPEKKNKRNSKNLSSVDYESNEELMKPPSFFKRARNSISVKKSSNPKESQLNQEQTTASRLSYQSRNSSVESGKQNIIENKSNDKSKEKQLSEKADEMKSKNTSSVDYQSRELITEGKKPSNESRHSTSETKSSKPKDKSSNHEYVEENKELLSTKDAKTKSLVDNSPKQENTARRSSTRSQNSSLELNKPTEKANNSKEKLRENITVNKNENSSLDGQSNEENIEERKHSGESRSIPSEKNTSKLIENSSNDEINEIQSEISKKTENSVIIDQQLNAERFVEGKYSTEARKPSEDVNTLPLLNNSLNSQSAIETKNRKSVQINRIDLEKIRSELKIATAEANESMSSNSSSSDNLKRLKTGTSTTIISRTSAGSEENDVRNNIAEKLLESSSGDFTSDQESKREGPKTHSSSSTTSSTHLDVRNDLNRKQSETNVEINTADLSKENETKQLDINNTQNPLYMNCQPFSTDIEIIVKQLSDKCKCIPLEIIELLPKLINDQIKNLNLESGGNYICVNFPPHSNVVKNISHQSLYETEGQSINPSYNSKDINRPISTDTNSNNENSLIVDDSTQLKAMKAKERKSIDRSSLSVNFNVRAESKECKVEIQNTKESDSSLVTNYLPLLEQRRTSVSMLKEYSIINQDQGKIIDKLPCNHCPACLHSNEKKPDQFPNNESDSSSKSSESLSVNSSGNSDECDKGRINENSFCVDCPPCSNKTENGSENYSSMSTGLFSESQLSNTFANIKSKRSERSSLRAETSRSVSFERNSQNENEDVHSPKNSKTSSVADYLPHQDGRNTTKQRRSEANTVSSASMSNYGSANDQLVNTTCVVSSHIARKFSDEWKNKKQTSDETSEKSLCVDCPPCLNEVKRLIGIKLFNKSPTNSDVTSSEASQDLSRDIRLQGTEIEQSTSVNFKSKTESKEFEIQVTKKSSRKIFETDVSGSNEVNAMAISILNSCISKMFSPETTTEPSCVKDMQKHNEEQMDIERENIIPNECIDFYLHLITERFKMKAMDVDDDEFEKMFEELTQELNMLFCQCGKINLEFFEKSLSYLKMEAEADTIDNKELAKIPNEENLWEMFNEMKTYLEGKLCSCKNKESDGNGSVAESRTSSRESPINGAKLSTTIDEQTNHDDEVEQNEMDDSQVNKYDISDESVHKKLETTFENESLELPGHFNLNSKSSTNFSQQETRKSIDFETKDRSKTDAKKSDIRTSNDVLSNEKISYDQETATLNKTSRKEPDENNVSTEEETRSIKSSTEIIESEQEITDDNNTISETESDILFETHHKLSFTSHKDSMHIINSPNVKNRMKKILEMNDTNSENDNLEIHELKSNDHHIHFSEEGDIMITKKIDDDSDIIEKRDERNMKQNENETTSTTEKENSEKEDKKSTSDTNTNIVGSTTDTTKEVPHSENTGVTNIDVRGHQNFHLKDDDDEFHSALTCNEVYKHEETYLTLLDKVAMNPMNISDLFPRKIQLADNSENSSNPESFFTAECPYFYEVSKFSTVYAQRMTSPCQNRFCSDKQVGTGEYTAKSRSYGNGRIYRIEPNGKELAEVAINRENDDLDDSVDKIKVRIRLTDERHSKKAPPSLGSSRNSSEITINRSRKFSMSLADFNVKYETINENIVQETKVVTDGDKIKVFIPLELKDFENEN